VYFNYGVHWLVNAVTEAEGSPAAVLIRALEPTAGIDLMRVRRAARRGQPSDYASDDAVASRAWAGKDTDLCRGPGNLTRALAITGAQNHTSLSRGPLRIERLRTPRRATLPVAWSPRIGIRVGQDRPWRAYLAGHPAVSGRPR
jgi:DNA-3-methyladenine glycosylase